MQVINRKIALHYAHSANVMENKYTQHIAHAVSTKLSSSVHNVYEVYWLQTASSFLVYLYEEMKCVQDYAG